ncbi:MAG TPA: TlpA disulfide reductase family protein [Acidimicrobiales bacterium]|nr:TlpA disulfide reductase family protein [Acidimicrobiales bacterium]
MEIARDGKPKLVMFLAHWCPHCQAEVPVLVDWASAGQPQGVDLVAVSTAVDRARPDYPPSAWLEREGWTIPTVADDADGTAAAAFGLTGYPYFVAVTGDGKVAARASGEQTVSRLAALAAAARG